MTPTLLPASRRLRRPCRLADVPLPAVEAEVRTARPDEAGDILALVRAHQDEGHLLPRSRAPSSRRGQRASWWR
ncbi:MAG: hypothetical protein R2745_24950 [Vicinamibacterales bacterium]